MTKDEFNTLYEEALERLERAGEWSTGDCIDLTDVFAEIVNEKRKLNELRDLIEKSHQERNNENDQ